MSPSLFRPALLAFLLFARLTLPSSPTQAVFSLWFEASGVTPEQAEIIASRFAAAADESARLALAGQLDAPDLVVQLTVGGAVVNAANLRPTSLAFNVQGSGVDAERARVPLPSETLQAVEVTITAIDVLDGEVLYDENHRCELPLTQGSSVAAACLRASFPEIIDRLEAWAAGEDAASAVASFGPSDADLRRLGPGELAAVYFREGLAASRAGFENKALELMAAAQRLFKETGRRRDEAAAWEHLAYLMAATSRGPDRAIDYAEQTIRIARELEDEAIEARALALLAACEARSGNYDRALTVARSAASKANALDDALTRGMGIAIQAGVYAARGNVARARPMQAQALGLVRRDGPPRAIARIELAAAAVEAQGDGRVRSRSLAMIARLGEQAATLGDRALQRDIAFVAADTRAATTELPLVTAAEIDAIRALKLSDRLNDEVGHAAALGLLGMLGVRLGKLGPGFEYLSSAQQHAEEAGFLEGATDSLQVLGEEVPDLAYGAQLLEAVMDLRIEQGDLRGQVKTLSDLSRLQSGLERTDEAWATHRAATEVLAKYVAALNEGTQGEDLREGFATVLKSLMATRTELPYLARYLRIHPMIPLPNPTWVEG